MLINLFKQHCLLSLSWNFDLVKFFFSLFNFLLALMPQMIIVLQGRECRIVEQIFIWGSISITDFFPPIQTYLYPSSLCRPYLQHGAISAGLLNLLYP